MIAEFLLPDLGEGLPEAEIVQWHVAEGDAVTLNQTIAEVETAKAIVEIPSPYAGTVQGLHAAAGDVVAVGSPLVSFAVGVEAAGIPESTGRSERDAAAARSVAGSAAARSDAGSVDRAADSAVETPRSDDADRLVVADPRQTADATAPEERSTPNLVGYGATPSSGSRPRRRARGAGAAVIDVDTAVRVAAPHDVVRTGPIDLPIERPRSTPPVRKWAKDNGVDLVLVAAAHPGEVVTRAHVEEYATRTTPASAAPASTVPPAESAEARRPDRATGDRVTRTPIRGVRKHTAAAMRAVFRCTRRDLGRGVQKATA